MRTFFLLLASGVSLLAQNANFNTNATTTFSTNGNSNFYIAPASGGGSCNTAFDTNAGATNALNSVNIDSSSFYVGQLAYIPPSTTSAICTWSFNLTAVGTITGKTYTCTIYNDNNPLLGSLVATSTGVVGVNSWSGTEVKFVFGSGFTLTSGNSYDVVISCSGAVDAANYVYVGLTAAGGLTGLSATYDSGGNRTSFSTSDSKLTAYIP